MPQSAKDPCISQHFIAPLITGQGSSRYLLDLQGLEPALPQLSTIWQGAGADVRVAFPQQALTHGRGSMASEHHLVGQIL